MKTIYSLGLVSMMAMTGTGCAAVGSAVLPDSTLATYSLKVLPDESDAKDVTISDRHEEGDTTYYTVTLKKGKKYSCKVFGGSIGTIALMGMMQERPECEKYSKKGIK